MEDWFGAGVHASVFSIFIFNIHNREDYSIDLVLMGAIQPRHIYLFGLQSRGTYDPMLLIKNTIQPPNPLDVNLVFNLQRMLRNEARSIRSCDTRTIRSGTAPTQVHHLSKNQAAANICIPMKKCLTAECRTVRQTLAK